MGAKVGIDDMALHFPKLYMDMEDFAEMRGADYGKLNQGLGLAVWQSQTFTKILLQWVQTQFAD